MLEKPAIQVEGLVHHGCCETAQDVEVYYALFGQGPTKIVLLMGIATPGVAWKNQIEFFVQFPEYQVLVVDNRGCGNTKTPAGRITTSQMAGDVVAVMRHLHWDQGKVHLVGISLGGMIAQEVALQVPDQIATLSLLCTHAGGWKAYIPPWQAILSLSRQFFVGSEKEKTQIMLETVFSKQHLSKPGVKQNLSIIQQEYPTILDFYVNTFVDQFGNLITKSVRLFAQQLSAVLTHRVSSRRLSQIKNKFPILVCTGTGDKVVHPSHSRRLSKVLDAELVTFDGAGHALTEECLDDINVMLRKHFWRSVN